MLGKSSSWKAATYLRSQQNLQRDIARLTRRYRVGLCFGLGCLGLLCYIMLHQPTYLIPFGLDKPVTVSINRASPHYLMLLARSDASMYFDVTPQSVSGAFNLFLTRVQPSRYGDIQLALKQRIANYKKDNKSTLFFPDNRITVDHNSVTLPGQLNTYIDHDLVSHQSIQLHIQYAFDNGRAMIAGWHYE